jgi:Ca2+-binding EF-hand superfamily protein
LPAVIFHFYDANGDGRITLEEMREICVPLYKLCFGGTERQAQQVSLFLILNGR